MVISCPPSHLQFYHISHCPSFSWLWTLLHPIWHNLYLKNLPSPFCFYYVWICSYMLCYAKSLQSCPTLSDPMDCSLTGSSVHGIFQARVLEWGAIAFSGISSHGSYLFLFFSTHKALYRLLFIHFRLSWWFRWWRICLQCWRPGFDPWVGKIPWRRKWLLTPVFLPGEFHGQRSLTGYSSWGCRSQTRLSD